MTTRLAVSWGIVLLAGLAAGGPRPGRADPGPSPSLEQQLLEDLDVLPLDPNPQPTKPGLQPKPSADKTTEEPKTLEDLQEELFRELGEAAVSEEDNPLVEVVQRMQQAQGLLRQAETGQKTQQLQAEILATLDELLKAAQQPKQNPSGGKSQPKQSAPRRTPDQAKAKPSAQSKPSTKPAQQTGKARSGQPQARRPDMAEMSEVLKNVWGELPEHQREQMLELPIEEFLPKYELLIEAYFKRLAEEQGRE